MIEAVVGAETVASITGSAAAELYGDIAGSAAAALGLFGGESGAGLAAYLRRWNTTDSEYEAAVGRASP